MIRAVLAMVAASAYAQGPQDARPVLQQIANAARSTRSWRAEGVSLTEMTGDGMHTTLESRFKMVKQGPVHSRYEITGAEAGTRVCDGTALWIDFSRAGFHTRNPLGERCTPPVVLWEDLSEGLIGATFAGRDQVDFEGSRHDCELVRAEYDTKTALVPGLPVVGRVLRTMCIDRARNLVLRDRLEGVPAAGRPAILTTTMTFTYSKVERDPELTADVFHFEPAPGSFLNQTVAAPPKSYQAEPPLGVDVYVPGAGVTSPSIASSREPEYSDAARKAGISGTVLLSVDVGPEGIARQIRIINPLGYGLDEQAVAAVMRWRFHPGTKDGKPVTVRVRIEVSFQLHKP